MIVRQIVVSPVFASNCFLVGCEKTKEALVIDPGDQPEMIMREAGGLGLEITLIIATHAHIDHIGGAEKIRSEKKVEFRLHRHEAPLAEAFDQQCEFFNIRCGEKPKIDGYIDENDEIKVGEYTGKVISTPGHSPGGVCIYFPGHLFAGDTLFQGSIGRTDLPGGSYDQLIGNIKEKLLVLPPDTIVHCGHGPDTTIGHEKSRNPFLTGKNILW